MWCGWWRWGGWGTDLKVCFLSFLMQNGLLHINTYWKNPEKMALKLATNALGVSGVIWSGGSPGDWRMRSWIALFLSPYSITKIPSLWDRHRHRLFVWFFFFFPFIFISWRLITLRYCSGFCHTLTWINRGFTCFPHPDPPPTSLSIPSLWVFPVHQPRALVSCIQPGLVICFTFDSILVSMLFSQNISPFTLAFSHRVQKSALYICVSFSVLHIGLSLPSF